MLARAPSEYPVFVLAFCIFEIHAYVYDIQPEVNRLKFEFFGQDLVIFHESEIRRKTGAFRELNDPVLREKFLDSLTQLMAQLEFKIVPVVEQLDSVRDPSRDNYSVSAVAGINKCLAWLNQTGSSNDEVLFVFESRGATEDKKLADDLHEIFWHANAPAIRWMFIQKSFASTGLEIADLVARPIGLASIRPNQANRSFHAISKKIVN